MEEFKDFNGNTVRLSFKPNTFIKLAKHVLVICEYNGQWVLTNHKKRGLEFPGGKVEADETLEAAAKREVYEETGAVIRSLDHIGDYEVLDKNNIFIKAIFYGKVERIVPKENYLETDGPVLIGEDLLEKRLDSQYSFIMKDRVIEESLKYVNGIRKQNL
ncbi:RNA deprotection pyrophosphohydrolase [Cytobacillus sp. FJAT-54145]|uniref:RNA deprotection pyrophosphohydrolase n=1 Tax=Cytobacillus spartinae TaxID=3299023 RepID=A0ABW6KKF1_9BACI